MKLIIHNIFIVLKRFGVSCILSVTGLSIAYAVFYMTVVQTHYDFRFDRNFEKADSIYLYSRVIPGSEALRTVTNSIEPKECAERYSEIKDFCYLSHSTHPFEMNDNQTGEVRNFNETLTQTSIGFINLFKPKILLGDVKQAFIPGNVMLTESVAKKMFGNKNPIGEIITLYGANIIVAAVCSDFPSNCCLKNGLYQYEPEGSRRNWNFTTYFEIDPSNRDRLLEKMNNEQYMQKAASRENEVWQYELTALPDIHLWFPAKGEGNPVTVLLLLTIGILLLVVSCINFLLFSIAMAPIRVKNVNIRKILGESSFRLKLSVVMEAVFLSFVSFLLSILIINLLNTGALKDFFRADLAISKNGGLLFVAGAVSILSGFLAGLYPAFYVVAFNPAMALSGSFSHSLHSKWLKNILMGVQLAVAIFLITTTLFFKIQYDYIRNKDWGIQTENVLYFNTESERENVDNLMVELKRSPNIVDVTAAAHYPGQEEMRGWGRMFEDIQVHITVWAVKPDFFDFFGVNTVKGNRFTENDKEKIILNRAFSKEYGFSGDLEGKELSDHEIIGIVEDFNYKSLHGSIQPLAFIPIDEENKGRYYNWVFVKTDATNTKQTIESIRDTWKKFSDKPVEVLSLTGTIHSLYKKEHDTASLVSMCGVIAIIVAIIGLYGLILFDAKAKRKSIAIRKIHGASIREIMLELNQSLFVRFAVSCLIAFPLAYHAVQRWLEDFAYKTPVYGWVFALGGFIVLSISLLTVSWESYKAASANPVQEIKSE